MKAHTFTLLSGVMATFILAASAQAAETVAQTYDIKDVSELVVTSGGRVHIIQDNTESLRVEATPEMMGHVSVDLTSNKLSLKSKGTKRKFWFFQNSYYDQDGVNYELHVKTLSSIDLSGAARADVEHWSGKLLSVNASGASEIFFKPLTINSLIIDLSGASKFHSKELSSTNVKFNLSGAASVDIEGKSSASNLQLELSGASNYHGKLLEVSKADVELSGASTCEIHAVETLKAEAAGASHILYLGSPQTSFKSSGVSDIKSINQ